MTPDQELAARAVRRLAGDEVSEILAALGLAPYKRAGRDRRRYDTEHPWQTAPAGGRGVACTAGAITNRRHQYAELRQQGLNRTQAAERMGIHPRTADRYEACIRQEAA